MHWYIRSNNKVTGPFPAGQIKQSILLGRIDLNDEASTDKEDWKAIRTLESLIPEVLLGDPNNPTAMERLEAAKRWADERRGERRHAESPERTGPGRREPESQQELEYRSHREVISQSLRRGNERSFAGLVVVIILLMVGVYAGFKFVPQPEQGAQCQAAARAGINWSNCNKAGLLQQKSQLAGAILNSTNLQGADLSASNLSEAELSYADLSRSNLSLAQFQMAQLKGTNLRSADLNKADFTYADLSYANLQGATVRETIFTGAKLDNVIWVNGQLCLPGSVGQCRVGK